jgi:hypothetical protein
MENPTSIRDLIRQTKASLKWPVRVLRGEQGLEVFSDPKAQIHTLYFPRDGSATLIEVLRNLGHATLAEKVHPVFGGALIEECQAHQGTLGSVFKATSLWFAQNWLMGVIPNEARLDLAMRLSKPDCQKDRFHLSLLVAEGIHCLGRDLRRGDRGLVEAFLLAPPERPSLEGYMRLANLLLAPSGLHAALTDEGSWFISEIHPQK